MSRRAVFGLEGEARENPQRFVLAEMLLEVSDALVQIPEPLREVREHVVADAIDLGFFELRFGRLLAEHRARCAQGTLESTKSSRDLPPLTDKSWGR